MKSIFLIILIFLTSNAIASATYTKDQLNSMASAGQFPAQEPPVTKGVENISFDMCQLNAKSTYNQVVGSYPVREIVDTNDLYIVKIWTNDGVIMVSCSKPDNKKVVTQSSYKE